MLIGSYQTIQSYSLNLKLGYNLFEVDQKIQIPKGSYVRIFSSFNGAKIAINNNTDVVYSDYGESNNKLYKLNLFLNQHFLLNCLIDQQFYESVINQVLNWYPSTGTYNVSAKFLTNSSSVISNILRTVDVKARKQIYNLEIK